jgi:hypothetical protein
MAWTATVQQVNKDSDRPTAVILFTDGLKYKRLETFDLNGLTFEQFKSVVEAKRKMYDDQFTWVDTFTTSTPITPTAAPVKTQAEIDKDTFFANYLKLQSLNALITHKVITGTEKFYTDHLAVVKLQFKSTYFI